VDVVTSQMLGWLINNWENASSVDVALQVLAEADHSLPIKPLDDREAGQLVAQRLDMCFQKDETGNTQVGLRDVITGTTTMPRSSGATKGMSKQLRHSQISNKLNLTFACSLQSTLIYHANNSLSNPCLVAFGTASLMTPKSTLSPTLLPKLKSPCPSLPRPINFHRRLILKRIQHRFPSKIYYLRAICLADLDILLVCAHYLSRHNT